MRDGSQRTLQIRIATRADTPVMIAIVNEAFSIEDFIDGTRTDEARMSGLMEKGAFLVGEDEGRIVASVYCEIRGERAYMGMLAIDPAQQGRGLGRLMTEAAEDYCRKNGCKFLDIAVLSLRPELPPLYRKFGFVETGTEEFKPSVPLKAGYECYAIKMSKAL